MKVFSEEDRWPELHFNYDFRSYEILYLQS